MNTEKLTSFALTGLDRVGYQLESFGITDRVNRHTLAALLMAEKIRFEGEMDSLHAKTARYRYLAEKLRKWRSSRHVWQQKPFAACSARPELSPAARVEPASLLLSGVDPLAQAPPGIG